MALAVAAGAAPSRFQFADLPQLPDFKALPPRVPPSVPAPGPGMALASSSWNPLPKPEEQHEVASTLALASFAVATKTVDGALSSASSGTPVASKGRNLPPKR